MRFRALSPSSSNSNSNSNSTSLQPIIYDKPNKERTKNEFGMDNWLRKTVKKKKKSKSSQAKPRGVSELFQTRERDRGIKTTR
jgi:hypothetical protein